MACDSGVASVIGCFRQNKENPYSAKGIANLYILIFFSFTFDIYRISVVLNI